MFGGGVVVNMREAQIYIIFFQIHFVGGAGGGSSLN